MTSPSVKATEALANPAAAKLLLGILGFYDETKPRVISSYKKVRRQFLGKHPKNNKIYPKFVLRRYNQCFVKLTTYIPAVKKCPFAFLRLAVEKCATL